LKKDFARVSKTIFAFTRTFSGSDWKLRFLYEVIIMSNEQASTIAAQVYALVRACPAGRVTTYGWVVTQ
jgi:hypothetical protein